MMLTSLQPPRSQAEGRPDRFSSSAMLALDMEHHTSKHLTWDGLTRNDADAQAFFCSTDPSY
jgi:hypothetical protein